MQDMILLKQGEIVLKGLNRRRFEQRLVSNIAQRLRPYGSFQVYTLQSTVYVEPQSDGCDMDGALEALKTVFGIVALTRAAACAKDRDAIVEKAISYLAPAMRRAKSFKVETRRSDKSFPMTSIQLSQYVGGLLAEAFPDVAVDVHTPELVVNVEVRDRAAYVHAGAEPGAGGMPVGSNGTAVTLLSGGVDSPVSSYMIAKRGVRLIPVHFFSFPYTSEAAKEKVIALGRRLTPYCGQMRLAIVPFTRIQEEIRDKCPEPYFTILMRRFMMRIADRLARDNGCGALVTGENLGQVASQTMQALAVTEEVCTLPVLRPLIGFDKTEIVDRARKIGTYELSVLPYEDCCMVFTPRHPELRPELERARAAEAELDVERLVEEAVRGTEYVRLEEAEP
ncbi:MAG: tRNA 4-thiouridine(8) synthase ThiI [Oscillospiraceae bacterium]|nr:tRNA 4-thiouridine(8) synthase ThiI [Oscillospiraceae bacterium]MCD7934944.1 tRNA 4-thiouridine(8) synthase ThiI [Oscillospiraceae bacterium]